MMRTWFRSLRRGSQVALVLLLVTVISVAAWAAFLMLSAGSVFQIAYQTPPEELATVIIPIQCSVLSGDGIAEAPIYDPINHEFQCAVSGVNETTHIQAKFTVDNSASTVPVLVTYTAPVTTCFDIMGVPPAARLVAAGAMDDMVMINMDANAETLGCALLTPAEDFIVGIQIDPQ